MQTIVAEDFGFVVAGCSEGTVSVVDLVKTLSAVDLNFDIDETEQVLADLLRPYIGKPLVIIKDEEEFAELFKKLQELA